MKWSLSRLWRRTLLQVSLVVLVFIGSYAFIYKNPKRVANIVDSIEDLTGASIANQWEEDIHVLTDVAWKECTSILGIYETCSIKVKYSSQESKALTQREDVKQRLLDSQYKNKSTKKEKRSSDDVKEEQSQNPDLKQNQSNDEISKEEDLTLSNVDDLDESGHVRFYGNVIPKDLYLGKRWFKKLYLVSIKTEVHTAAKHDIKVIEDMVIFNPYVNQRLVGENKALEVYLSKKQIPFKVYKQVAGTSGLHVSVDEINYDGWYNAGHGLWVKKGGKVSSSSMTDLNVLFGRQSVDPRFGWQPLPMPLSVTDITKSKGKLETEAEMDVVNIDYHQYDNEAYVFYKPRKTKKMSEVKASAKSDGTFKILQLADLHFSTGYGTCQDPWPVFQGDLNHCLADKITLEFVNKVLDIEQPDMVVLTGDQIYGEACPDSETALLKVVAPLIERSIPYAAVFGNHDDEGGSLSREGLMDLLEQLPYSLSKAGTSEMSGVGNYIVNVAGSSKTSPIVMYFLDSHAYPKGKMRGYDWIKEDQIEAVKAYHEEEMETNSIELAFFHIPLQEYVPPANQQQDSDKFVGTYKEGVMAGVVNTGMYSALRDIGVKFVSVGHDHCNDYCLKGEGSPEGDKEGVWMCYGGGSGEGGYGGYGGFNRRVRVFEVNTKSASIETWMRKQEEPSIVINHLVLS